MTDDRTTWAAEARRVAIEECLAKLGALPLYEITMRAHGDAGMKKTFDMVVLAEAQTTIRSLLDKEPK